MAGITRKTVTVLFIDIVDSTSLGEELDPERMRAVTGRYFDEMKAVIERLGKISKKRGTGKFPGSLIHYGADITVTNPGSIDTYRAFIDIT